MTMTTTHEHETKLAALRASVFGALTPGQLEDVARVSDFRHLGEGDVLCEQNDFGQDAFVIATGSVSVTVDGAEVATLGAGDIVGDWALFGSGYRAASVRATTCVGAVVIDAREIDSLLMAVPAATDLLGPRPTAR